MAITPASNRYYKITPKDDGNILEIGPASAQLFTGMWAVQINPSQDFVGALIVMGRLNAPPTVPITAVPFQTFPYRRMTLNGVASDVSYVTDPIVGSGILQIPGSGYSIGFSVQCAVGSCTIVAVDLQGSPDL